MSEEEINVKDYILNAKVDEGFDDVKDVPDELIYPDAERMKSDTFPKEYTRPLVVPVFNQGRIGSCVGCSGKVVATDPGYHMFNLSAMWIYKMAKKYDVWAGEDYSGTSIPGAIESLKRVGVCQEHLFPYNGNTEDVTPQKDAPKDAKTRTINAGYKLTFKDENISKIKKLLQKESLWTSFYVHDEFYRFNSKGFMNNEINYLNSGKRGGHAMALVGWKEMNGVLYWKFQNSWGRRWANQGFCYISHDLYKKISKGVFYIDTKVENEVVPVFKSKTKLFDIIRKPFDIILKLLGSLGGIISKLLGKDK